MASTVIVEIQGTNYTGMYMVLYRVWFELIGSNIHTKGNLAIVEYSSKHTHKCH